MKLTKEKLLTGTALVHDVQFDRLGGTLALRSLSDGEWARVKTCMSEGISVISEAKSPEDAKVQIGIAEVTKSQFEANCLAVSIALSVNGDTWTIDEVKALRPAGIIEEIAQAVYELSSVSREEMAELHSFRNVKRGKGHADVTPDRVPSGENAG